MSDATAQNDGLSPWGVLCILIMVGLNTALTVGKTRSPAVSVADIRHGLPAYGFHLGLGCLIIAIIYYHQTRWQRT